MARCLRCLRVKRAYARNMQSNKNPKRKLVTTRDQQPFQ